MISLLIVTFPGQCSVCLSTKAETLFQIGLKHQFFVFSAAPVQKWAKTYPQRGYAKEMCKTSAITRFFFINAIHVLKHLRQRLQQELILFLITHREHCCTKPWKHWILIIDCIRPQLIF
eukprot:TRINITY_DN20406_c0_g1_i1.p1 TRINITY_DN20406_c0_g1~~TRINITY_DN20406_c0_g1_i1.p1  ORF type:complete len:119 (+),score=5.13 TRINITY_DN20406_c0_g1_i1:130-486(+)